MAESVGQWKGAEHDKRPAVIGKQIVVQFGA